VWSPRFTHRTRSTERCGQHLKHFNDGLGRGAGDATNRLLQHAHLRLSHIDLDLCDTETVVRGPSRRCWSGARAPAVSLSRNSVSLSVGHDGACRWVLAQCVAVGELLGYARVSTTVQDPALEHDALRAAGCRWLWTDTASGSRSDRVKTGAARVLTEDVCVLGS